MKKGQDHEEKERTRKEGTRQDHEKRTEPRRKGQDYKGRTGQSLSVLLQSVEAVSVRKLNRNLVKKKYKSLWHFDFLRLLKHLGVC